MAIVIGDSNGLIMYQGRAITPEQYAKETGVQVQAAPSGQVVVTQPTPAPTPAPTQAPVVPDQNDPDYYNSHYVSTAFTPGKLSNGGEIQRAVRQSDNTIYYQSYLGDGQFSQGSSRNLSASDQAMLNAYVAAHPEQQFAPRTADQQAAIENSMYVRVVKPTGLMVNLDYPSVNTPNGLADFKSKLAALPEGTAITLNNNENTAGMGYSYLGGIINDKGEFLQGFGAQTAGMRAVIDTSGLSQFTLVDTEPASSVKNSNTSSWLTSVNSKGVPNSIARPSNISYEEAPAAKELPEQVFDYIYGGHKPSREGSVIVDINRAVTSSFMARSAEVENIADNIGGLGGEVVRGVGYIGLTPFLIGSAATGAARVGETAITKGPGAAIGEMGGNLGANIPAMIQGAGEHPIATGITLIPVGIGIAGAAKGGSAASLGEGAIRTGSKAKTSIEGILDTTGKTDFAPGKIDANTIATKTPFRNVDYAPGGDLGPVIEKPTTKIAGALERSSAYDDTTGNIIGNANIFQDQQGNRFMVKYNENVKSYGLTSDEATKLYNNPKFTKLEEGGEKVIDLSEYGSREDILNAIEENPLPIQGAAMSMSGKFAGGQVRGSLWRQLLEDDQGAMPRQELITRQVPKSNTKVRTSFDDAFTKTAGNTKNFLKTTGRLTETSRFKYPVIGTGLTAAGLNSLLGSGLNNKNNITPRFDTGIFSGPSNKTYPIPKTGSKTKTTPTTFSGSPSNGKGKTDATMAGMLGVGAVGVGMMTLSRTPSFGKSVGGGGGGGSYNRMLGLKNSKQKYDTGDVTKLIYGKKKKSKRRSK